MGLLQIEDCLAPDGSIVLPPGVTLISLIDRNIAAVGDAVAYRYLDFTGTADVHVREITWNELGVRMRAIGARVQQVSARGDRVAILAPQSLEYVAAFFGAIRAGAVAVPLFAPELPGHAERLDVALRDARPSVVLTTAAARPAVEKFLRTMTAVPAPEVLTIDDIPDSAAAGFTPTTVGVDDVSHLQYTGGATRSPVGVEITHRAVGTNLIQMILSLDLLDRNTHGVSWLPLYHDMGLSLIGFPTVYGGHTTLMSPAAFVRRPLRWIEALSDGCRTGRVVTAAPNFAYEWAAARGVPAPGADVDLGNVSLIIGSEPVSFDAITTFNTAFASFGLPPTAFKPSYGLAEATLFVSTIAPSEQARVLFTDREELSHGRVVQVAADHPRALGHVCCGHVARSLWCAIVDPETASEQPDGTVGEIWLQGDNLGRGYWDRPAETESTFHARLNRPLTEDGHTDGAKVHDNWLRTGDLGFYLQGELFVTGRLADIVQIDDATHYPHDIESTVADASPVVRRGYVAVFTVDGQHLIVIAERATGTGRSDPSAAAELIRQAVRQRHGLDVADVRIVPAGAIPRTTSGKLARRACRGEYLEGVFD